MSKRYTESEDEFIVSHFDTVGPYIGPHDLGRSEASVKARAKRLRETGAWGHLQAARDAMLKFRVAAGHISEDDLATMKWLAS